MCMHIYVCFSSKGESKKKLSFSEKEQAVVRLSHSLSEALLWHSFFLQSSCSTADARKIMIMVAVMTMMIIVSSAYTIPPTPFLSLSFILSVLRQCCIVIWGNVI